MFIDISKTHLVRELFTDSHRGKFSHQINFGLTQINDGLINDDERLTMSVNFNKGIAACDRGDYATALSLLRPLADQGDVDAQFLLGFMYDDGEGVVQDRKEAVKWYRLAAAQGNAYAQLHLGLMYDNGRGGVPQDHKEAVKWFWLAAAQGNPSAQFRLGFMYDSGRGVVKDRKEAVMWYQLAADGHHPLAQLTLARAGLR